MGQTWKKELTIENYGQMKAAEENNKTISSTSL